MSKPASNPSRAELRRAAAENSRRKLLDAALGHFARRPYDEVAATDITESAGVASGLLFHHFESKRGIYREALAQARDALDAACEVDETAPSGRQIRELLTRHLTYLAANPDLALNVILNRSGPAEATNAFEETRWGLIGWATRALGLDAADPTMRVMWRTFGAAADEATSHWLRADRPYPIADLVEALVEVLVGALRGAARLDSDLQVARAVAALRRSQPSRPTRSTPTRAAAER